MYDPQNPFKWIILWNTFKGSKNQSNAILCMFSFENPFLTFPIIALSSSKRSDPVTTSSEQDLSITFSV